MPLSPRSLLAALALATAMPMAAPAAEPCRLVAQALSVCGEGWRPVATGAPGISLWSDGRVSGKLILERAGGLQDVSPDQVLKRALDSVAQSLSAGREIAVDGGSARRMGGTIYGTLSYTVSTNGSDVALRHTVLVRGDLIVQAITGDTGARADATHAAFLNALDFTDRGEAL